MPIRNPVEWGADLVRGTASRVTHVGETLHRPAAEFDTRVPEVRTIGIGDLTAALRQGVADFAASRTDVLAIGVIYPLAGLVLANFIFGSGLLPLLFPLIAGFALLGPFAAVGLYEMSLQRERGETPDWGKALEVVRSPNFGAVLGLGGILFVIFALWMAAASVIWLLTLGPAAPASASAFINEVFTTAAGWTMIVLGCGIGFLFAVLVLALAAVSFPMLIDRKVRIGTAVKTSVELFRRNPVTMLTWGAIVAAGLVLGSIPALLGLIVVMPVLGHATWHLYRRAIG